VVQVKQGRYDEALQTASANMQSSSPTLLYSHFEALRCLAEVRFRRGELDEAEKICREADEFISGTDSRVTQLWLGPLYIEVLLAAQKRAEALEKLTGYKSLVAECQSPRFTSEATRLAQILS
jgi:ATP/maltotriose-dependent transcriptional regulator MalT